MFNYNVIELLDVLNNIAGIVTVMMPIVIAVTRNLFNKLNNSKKYMELIDKANCEIKSKTIEFHANYKYINRKEIAQIKKETARSYNIDINALLSNDKLIEYLIEYIRKQKYLGLQEKKRYIKELKNDLIDDLYCAPCNDDLLINETDTIDSNDVVDKVFSEIKKYSNILYTLLIAVSMIVNILLLLLDNNKIYILCIVILECYIFWKIFSKEKNNR